MVQNIQGMVTIKAMVNIVRANGMTSCRRITVERDYSVTLQEAAETTNAVRENNPNLHIAGQFTVNL